MFHFFSWQTILGYVMNSETMRRLEEHFPEMEMKMHSMENIWTKEVSYPKPLIEARNVVQELLHR